MIGAVLLVRPWRVVEYTNARSADAAAPSNQVEPFDKGGHVELLVPS